jgi:cell division protein FtsL
MDHRKLGIELMKILAIVTVITCFIFLMVYQSIQNHDLKNQIEELNHQSIELAKKNRIVLEQIERIKASEVFFEISAHRLGFVPTSSQDFYYISPTRDFVENATP